MTQSLQQLRKRSPPQKYVGYVSKAIDVFDSKAEYHTYAIQFTSPTIPAACEGEGISPDMYTPIFPATAAHPGGRVPLHSRRVLPWSGCQQPSFMRSIVRVPVKLEDDTSAVLLEPDEAIRFRRILAEEDEQRRGLLGASQSSSFSYDDASSNTGGSYLEFSDLDDDDYARAHFSCPFGLLESDVEDDNYAEIVQTSRLSDVTVVVNVSYDLSQVAELPDPLQFFEEKRQLKELVAESRARTCQCSAPAAEPEPEVVIAAQNDVPLARIENMDSDFDPLPSPLRHIRLPERLSAVRIPSSLIREVTTTIRRSRYSLAYIGWVWRGVGWRISGL
ncbi:hypothetical protein MSAN_00571200 [Mycena sanguinolenta]|uniref:Uncharacterized protein n=1 Tax=Mycena sanguinolenta TaxID=230812 RepID=A0A8H6Z6S3_9AGAR|nr:hypothetical protein MSAN_00571200 [Mycena sanguinolenta]